MRAVGVLPAKRQLRIIDHAAPGISGPNEVKIQSLEVGICGTDREICAFAYGSPPEGSDYLVLGHESLGQVVEVGSAVSGFSPGDLVVPSVRRPCPHAHCHPCRDDKQDFCFTGDITERGIKEAHGFMTELVVDDERHVRALLVRWIAGRGYRVREAGSALAALGAMAIEPADTVVCDINMPGHDGIWLIDRITGEYPNVSIVVATGRGEMDPRVTLRPGVESYLLKPIDFRTFKIAIEGTRLAGDSLAAGEC